MSTLSNQTSFLTKKVEEDEEEEENEAVEEEEKEAEDVKEKEVKTPSKSIYTQSESLMGNKPQFVCLRIFAQWSISI